MKIIGISGLARSGKDMFTTVAQHILENKFNLRTKRFALANHLKLDLQQLILEKTKIDVFTDNSNDKKTIRPLLVAYGDVMRTVTQGTYWTNIVEQELKQLESNLDVAFITDIRYDEYPKDECFWLKEKMNGKLIHISKYKFDPELGVNVYDIPPNDHEFKNNPKLKAKADCCLEWEDYSAFNTPINEPINNSHVVEKVTNCLKNVDLI